MSTPRARTGSSGVGGQAAHRETSRPSGATSSSTVNSALSASSSSSTITPASILAAQHAPTLNVAAGGSRRDAARRPSIPHHANDFAYMASHHHHNHPHAPYGPSGLLTNSASPSSSSHHDAANRRSSTDAFAAHAQHTPRALPTNVVDYASSLDGSDFFSAPPSGPVSRTSTPASSSYAHAAATLLSDGHHMVGAGPNLPTHHAPPAYSAPTAASRGPRASEDAAPHDLVTRVQFGDESYESARRPSHQNNSSSSAAAAPYFASDSSDASLSSLGSMGARGGGGGGSSGTKAEASLRAERRRDSPTSSAGGKLASLLSLGGVWKRSSGGLASASSGYSPLSTGSIGQARPSYRFHAASGPREARESQSWETDSSAMPMQETQPRSGFDGRPGPDSEAARSHAGGYAAGGGGGGAFRSRSRGKAKASAFDGRADETLPLRGLAGAARWPRRMVRRSGSRSSSAFGQADGGGARATKGKRVVDSVARLARQLRLHVGGVLLFLVLFAAFAAGLTSFLKWYLNPDKEPLPWRTYCQEQAPFPHAYADALAPVDVLVGIMTRVRSFERRSIIRQTMASHTLPRDPLTGQTLANVQLKFFLSRPTSQLEARRVALEMEMFNDVVVLDMDDTGSARKTLNFFKWAAENATVPILRAVDDETAGGAGGSGADLRGPSSAPGAGTETPPPESVHVAEDFLRDAAGEDSTRPRFGVAWKKVDYVVKADDDAFIVLDELERHLRVTPRRMTYWGYLVKEWFMAGECYALSLDLVQWLASERRVEATAYGKEDTRTPRWLAMHPEYGSIHWRSERCWIYDHPRAGTPYSHGFLFPDEVERIRLEGKLGLTERELQRRGGEHASRWYSTVTRWRRRWTPPRPDLTIEEEAEALVEGGSTRWGAANGWRRPPRPRLPWDALVLESQDGRLRPPSLAAQAGGEGRGDEPLLDFELATVPATGLAAYGLAGGGGGGGTDPTPSGREEERTWAPDDMEERGAEDPADRDGPAAELVARSGAVPHEGQRGDRRHGKEELAPPAAAHVLQPPPPGVAAGSGDPSARGGARPRPKLAPLPLHKDEGGVEAALRSQRYLGKPHGGTVVVHYQKTTERWIETALVLIGKRALWAQSPSSGAAREWRMYGSPRAHLDGLVTE